jgi:PEGA domain
MRKISLSVLLFLILSGSALAAEKPFIAVFNLAADSTLDENIAVSLSDNMRNYIGSLNQFEEIDQQAATTILAANQIEFAKCLDLECALKAGKFLSADKILIGSISKRGKFVVSLTLIDVPTRNEENKVRKSCTCADGEYQSTVDTAASSLLSHTRPDIETAPAATTEPTPGSIYVKTEPPGARLYLDGEPLVGVSPVAIANLAAGSHRLVAKKHEMMAVRQIVIASGKNLNIAMNLTDQVTGSIFIDSFPQSLTVKLDEVVVGKTPLTIPNVPIGKHHIEIKHIDFVLYQSTIDVLPDDTTHVFSSILKPEWHVLELAVSYSGSFDNLQLVSIMPAMRIANPITLALKFDHLVSNPKQDLRFEATEVPATSTIHEGESDSFDIKLTSFDSVGFQYRYSPLYEFHKFDLAMGLSVEYWMLKYEMTSGIPPLTEPITKKGEMTGYRLSGEIMFSTFFTEYLSGFITTSVGLYSHTVTKSGVEFPGPYVFDPEGDVDLNQVRIGFGLAAHFL